MRAPTKSPSRKIIGHGILGEFRGIILRLRRDENVLQIRVMGKYRDGKKAVRRAGQDLRRVEFLNTPTEENPVVELLLKSPGIYQRISIKFHSNGMVMSESLRELRGFSF